MMVGQIEECTLASVELRWLGLTHYFLHVKITKKTTLAIPSISPVSRALTCGSLIKMSPSYSLFKTLFGTEVS